jgi:hypothetical protein
VSGESPASIRACKREWAAKAPHANCENRMPEASPKRQADNDLNHCPAASFGHWKIGNLSLFRVSRFGFRISAPRKAAVLRHGPAAVGAATTARLGRAVLCGWGADAGAGHLWDIRPAVNMLAGANPDGCAPTRPRGCDGRPARRAGGRIGGGGDRRAGCSRGNSCCSKHPPSEVLAHPPATGRVFEP